MSAEAVVLGCRLPIIPIETLTTNKLISCLNSTPPNRSIWRCSPGLSADSKLGCNSCSTDQLYVSIICLGFGVVVFVCGERKWLAYVAKPSPSVLRILCMRVCVSMCMWSWSELFVWTWCLESPGGVLGTSNTRKSGHTLNLSLQHNPHKERIQVSSPLP